MEMEWISIKEKLPRQGKVILICYTKYKRPKEICIATRWGSKKDWHFNGDDYQFDDSEVTHWMPLPKMPKK